VRHDAHAPENPVAKADPSASIDASQSRNEAASVMSPASTRPFDPAGIGKRTDRKRPGDSQVISR